MTAEAEPLIHKLVRQFYQELGGKQLLYIYGSDDSPMDVIVGANTSTGLNKMLTLAGGKLNLVAVSGDDWNGDGFLADEVADAVIASKAVCQAWHRCGHQLNTAGWPSPSETHDDKAFLRGFL